MLTVLVVAACSCDAGRDLNRAANSTSTTTADSVANRDDVCTDEPGSSTRALDPKFPIPTAPSITGEGDRGLFARDIILALTPILRGVAVDDAERTLTAAGWTVTVQEDLTVPSTVTPDMRWDRLVLRTCAGIVHTVVFD